MSNFVGGSSGKGTDTEDENKGRPFKSTLDVIPLDDNDTISVRDNDHSMTSPGETVRVVNSPQIQL